MSRAFTVARRSIKGHDSVLIVLHDQGDRPHSLDSSLQRLDSGGQTLHNLFPALKLVFPGAPNGESTSQWFDPDDDGLDGLDESVLRVQQLLRQEAHGIQGRWDRIILAGVGQGATVAVCAAISLVIPVEAAAGREAGHGQLGGLLAFTSDMHLSSLGRAVHRTSLPESVGHPERTHTTLIYKLGQDQSTSDNGRNMRDMLEEMNLAVAYKEYAADGDGSFLSSCFEDILTCIGSLA